MVRTFSRATAASAAVEFALLAPVLLLFIFGTLCFTFVFSVASGVQQLAAEAARASVAGLTVSERSTLVQQFLAANVGAYPFLNAQQLTVATATLSNPAPAFQVLLTYDLTRQIAVFNGLVPLPLTQVHGSAVVLTSSSL